MNSATQDVTIWPGDIGEWKEWSVASSDNSFACGAELQVEDYVGPWSDDTAANGLRLMLCDENDWNDQTTLNVFEGRWGSWRGPILCPENYFVDGAQVQYEDLVGSLDGTGINGARIHCSDDDGNEMWLDVSTGRFGNYRDPVLLSGGRIVGASVRYHDPCGTTCDDTALNGVMFRFLGGELLAPSGPVVVSPPTNQSVPSPSPMAARPSVRGTPTSAPTRSPMTTEQSSPSIAIAVVSSVAVSLLIVFGILFAVCLRKRKVQTKTTNDDTSTPDEHGGMESTENSVNQESDSRDNLHGRIEEPTIHIPVVGSNNVVAETDAKPDFKDQMRNIPVATAVAMN